MSYRCLGLLALFLNACSLSSLGEDGGLDGGGIFNPDAAIRMPDDSGGTNKNMAYVRLAQLSPALGAVDFCLRAKGSAYFDGPKFSSTNTPILDAGSADGGSNGVAFPGVSAYVQVPAAGATDVAIVAATDTSCSSAKLVGTITIDPNKRMTIAVMGAVKDSDAGTRALGIEAFVDDTTAHADAARLRIIHAALGGPTSNGYGSLAASIGFGNQVDPVADRIDPRHTATTSNAIPAIDALGYGSHAPIAGQSSLRFASLDPMTGSPWSTQPADLGLGANAVKTAFLVSIDQSFSVVLCGDLPSGGDMPCQVYTTK
jgi:hypothetical protein